MVRTQVIWTIENLPLITQVIADEIQILMDQGKSTDEKDIIDGPGPDQRTFIRPWLTLQDAEDFIIFINSLQVPPVSTAILPEVSRTESLMAQTITETPTETPTEPT